MTHPDKAAAEARLKRAVEFVLADMEQVRQCRQALEAAQAKLVLSQKMQRSAVRHLALIDQLEDLALPPDPQA